MIGSAFGFADDHALDAIKQFPMPAFKARNDVSGRNLQDFFQSSAGSAVRAVTIFVGVKGNAINVIPVFNRNAGDEFAYVERERIAANIAVSSSAADFWKRSLIRLQQYSIDILPMPNRHASNARGVICKDTVRNPSGAAAFFTIFLRGN